MCSAPWRRWEEREMNLSDYPARVGAAVAAAIVALVASFAMPLVVSAAGPNGEGPACSHVNVHAVSEAAMHAPSRGQSCIGALTVLTHNAASVERHHEI